MFGVGRPVTIVGLQGRTELNGCAGSVLGAVRNGRLPVRVKSVEDDVCEVLVRLQNLAVRETEVYSRVLEDRELLGVVLSTISRWERSGRASGVAKLWRLAVLSDPAQWEHVVLVTSLPCLTSQGEGVARSRCA